MTRQDILTVMNTFKNLSFIKLYLSVIYGSMPDDMCSWKLGQCSEQIGKNKPSDCQYYVRRVERTHLTTCKMNLLSCFLSVLHR